MPNQKMTDLCGVLVGLFIGMAVLLYGCLADSHVYARLGMSVQFQLIAHRVATILVFSALAAALPLCASLSRQISAATRRSYCLKGLRIAVVILLPIIFTLVTMRTPFWSGHPPSGWERPMLLYGWPFPVKGEWGFRFAFFVLPINWISWTVYVMAFLGYRRLWHYCLAVIVPLLCLFALF